MAFQTTVNLEQGFGVPGDIHTSGPTRAEVLIINSSGAANNYGYAYTKDATTNIARVGGTALFAGILGNGKQATLNGTASGALAPTLAVPDYSHGDLFTMGDIVVRVASACKIGDYVVYNTTTGELSTVTNPATPGAGKALVPNAVIYRYPVTATTGGLTVVRLTN